MLSLFATVQQPLSRDIFTAQIFLPQDKLIKLVEGMLLAHTVKKDPYLLGNILTGGHVDCHYQLRNDADLRIPLHATTQPLETSNIRCPTRECSGSIAFPHLYQ